MSANHQLDPLRPHVHEPNPAPPSADPTFSFIAPDGTASRVTVADLMALPVATVADCYIVSTGHGTSGPFTFEGATLLDLVQSRLGFGASWSQVEVVSADGFGNRVLADELFEPDPAGPVLLSYRLDGDVMSREQGLVRMIVRSEKDDALRQVKWIGQIVVKE